MCGGPSLTERNFKQKPYFKVYNDEDHTNANLVARIYFDITEYVYPEHTEPGKKPWYFNSSERKIVDNILNKNWDDLLVQLHEFAPGACFDKPDYKLLRRR